MVRTTDHDSSLYGSTILASTRRGANNIPGTALALFCLLLTAGVAYAQDPDAERDDHFGTTLARGDFNGDRYEDLLQGKTEREFGGSLYPGHDPDWQKTTDKPRAQHRDQSLRKVRIMKSQHVRSFLTTLVAFLAARHISSRRSTAPHPRPIITNAPEEISNR
jgi:hypothetical protein